MNQGKESNVGSHAKPMTHKGEAEDQLQIRRSDVAGYHKRCLRSDSGPAFCLHADGA